MRGGEIGDAVMCMAECGNERVIVGTQCASVLVSARKYEGELGFRVWDAFKLEVTQRVHSSGQGITF